MARLSAADLGDHEYAEPYTDGVEYSVLVYRDGEQRVVFPPVWKGATGTDLLPPWRRLRLCPYPQLPAELGQRLGSIALDLADAADTVGFVEVEYLVTGDGRELILEINPRVSGTMRISALATGVPVFALPEMPSVNGFLRADRYAVEVPHSGAPFIDPVAGIYATSRLTMVADHLAGLRRMLREQQGEVFDSLLLEPDPA